MPELQDFRAMYEAHHDRIERIITYFCGKNGLAGAEAEEFASWARERLIADDYAVFRKFQGKAQLPTYLTAVVANLVREYRVSRQGRWRPSAAALHRGELAVRLERLVNRDGLRWGEAAEVVRTSGEADLPLHEITTMIAELPARAPVRPVPADPAVMEEMPSPSRADDTVLDAETAALRSRVIEALFQAIRRLPHEDQVALRMRYWEGMTVSDVARGTQRTPKRLFKRIDWLMVLLRRDLEVAGVSRELANEILEGLES